MAEGEPSKDDQSLAAFVARIGSLGSADFEAGWGKLLQKSKEARSLEASVREAEDTRKASLQDEIASIVDEVMAALEERLAGPVIEDEHLLAKVRVEYDESGVADVRAENEPDGYFAQGYVTAQDRLWQMDLMRRISAGRAAEILGQSMLDSDRHFRVYQFEKVSQAAVENLTPALKVAFESYAAGVNARIERFAREGWPWEFERLGYEPAPWTPADSVLVSKLQSEALSTNWLNDLLRAEFTNLPADLREDLFPGTSPFDVEIFPLPEGAAEDLLPIPPVAADLWLDARKFGKDISIGADAMLVAGEALPAVEIEGEEQIDVLTGGDARIDQLVRRKKARAEALRCVSMYGRRRAMSNNWVVSGEKTASGAPMLANDPHLEGNVPCVWHMIRMETGEAAFSGVTIPGIPGVLIGRNADFAWAVTNVGADVQDLFRVDTSAAAANVSEETVTITVALPDGSHREESMVVRSTPVGPLIYEDSTSSYALAWPALDPENDNLSAFYGLCRANCSTQAREALRDYAGPPQNFLFASASGDIGAQLAGCVINRRSGDLGLPREYKPGESRQVLADFALLPRLDNPASGIIATANNRTVPLDYPISIASEWIAPYRARRIVELLDGRVDLKIEDFFNIQGDTYSLADALFARVVADIARPLAAGDSSWEAISSLFEGWDATISPSSTTATLAVAMRDAFTRLMLEPHLDPRRLETYVRWDSSFSLIDRILIEQPEEWLPPSFDSYGDVVMAAFERAIAQLSERMGSDIANWQWTHSAGAIRFTHPLAPVAPDIASSLEFSAPNGTGGSGGTINAGQYVSMRFCADMCKNHAAGGDALGLTLGQSGDYRSFYFDNQFPGWLAVKPEAFPNGVGDQEASTVAMTLRPPSGAQATSSQPKKASAKPASPRKKTSARPTKKKSAAKPRKSAPRASKAKTKKTAKGKTG